MKPINRAIFFRDFPARMGFQPKPSQIDGLNFLLDNFERDPSLTQRRHAAYILATANWETAGTFQPVRERRANKTRQPQLWARQQKYWPSGYYGRGYVQITWKENYHAAGRRILRGVCFEIDGKKVTFDDDTLARNPDYALHPAVAYHLLVRGMQIGLYTGKTLAQYIPDAAPPDYANARRIINGTDHQHEIAATAIALELLLRAAA